MNEVKILILSGALHLILLFAHGTYIALTNGISWGTGRRDQPMPVTNLGRRFERTIINNMESMAAFLPVMAGSLILNTNNETVYTAAILYLFSRFVFTMLYLGNIPYLRTAAWLCGQFAIATIAILLIMT